MKYLMIELVQNVSIAIYIYFIAYCAISTILLFISFPDIINRFDEVRYGNLDAIINNNLSMPMSIVVPVYNLSDEVLDSVSSILNSNYKKINIVIVNDGSTDGTLKKMIKTYQLIKVPAVIRQKIKTASIRGCYESLIYPNLVVVDKVHGGAGDALNAGVNACRTPIFASVDADTLLERDAITRIMFTFLSEPNCISVGGAVYIINDNEVKDGIFVKKQHLPRHIVPALQVCEYVRSFMFSRAGWNFFGGSLSYAGAFTLFEKEAVIASGGYDTDNFAQDAEIILKLHDYMRQHKFPYTICYTPAAISWTEVPKNLFSYWRQRDRWQRGLMRSFCLHRHMFLNPKYGVVGMFTYPVYIVFELLTPLVEFTAYLAFGAGLLLGIVSLEMFLLFIALAVGYAAFLTLASVFMNLLTFKKYAKFSDGFVIFMMVIVEMFGFRQYHTVCRTIATGRYCVNRLLGQGL
jgi:cellulose synthase/poly-beta-1,6-N-acetylglucosamine synthase-like glycosyltransferase